MPVKGQVITDKFTGDIVEFMETSADTGGVYVRMKLTRKTKNPFSDDHIHVLQDESFQILSGRMAYVIDGETRYVDSGEEITLPKNKAHNHFNPDDEPLVYIQTFTPGLDMDFFFENMFGMINDGKIRNGKIPFPQKIATGRYLQSPTRQASIPMGLQNVMINLLGPIVRMLGYRALYEQYTGQEK